MANALLNLAINSRDAMSGHGKLTIEAGNASLDDNYVARHAEVSAGQPRGLQQHPALKIVVTSGYGAPEPGSPQATV